MSSSICREQLEGTFSLSRLISRNSEHQACLQWLSVMKPILSSAMTPAGDTTMHSGEVLAFDKEKGQHLVFYDDGEDEWVDLLAQPVTWQDHARGVTIAHGLPAGEPCPWKKAPGSAFGCMAGQGSVHLSMRSL